MGFEVFEIVLAPTANAMRKMLQICNEYAAKFSISLNDKKSKCVLVEDQANQYVYNLPRDHPGHILDSTQNESKSTLFRRGKMIGQN